MPLDRIERSRQLYDGGICGGCGVRLDATICRCDPQFRDAGRSSFDTPEEKALAGEVLDAIDRQFAWQRHRIGDELTRRGYSAEVARAWNVIEGEQH